MDLYVVNLIERTDRWEKIKKRFPDFNIIRIDAIKHEDGIYGSFLSQRKCLQIAKDNNLPYICVLEDDCVPTNDFKERFGVIKEYLDTHHDWDIFLGGGTKILKKNLVKKIQYKTEKFGVLRKMACAHMIIYNKKVYDFFLNMKYHAPIDRSWWYKFTALVPSPFVATQDEGYSDIAKEKVCYINSIDMSNRALSYFIASLP